MQLICMGFFIIQAIVEFGIDESEAIPQSTFLAQAMEYPLRALVC